MPGLGSIFRILENDLNEVPKVGSHNSSAEGGTARRAVGDATEAEDAGDVVVVGHFERSVCLQEGYTIDCIALLPVDHYG